MFAESIIMYQHAKVNIFPDFCKVQITNVVLVQKNLNTLT